MFSKPCLWTCVCWRVECTHVFGALLIVWRKQKTEQTARDELRLTDQAPIQISLRFRWVIRFIQGMLCETCDMIFSCVLLVFLQTKKERMRSAPGACKFCSPLTYCIVHWGCYVFLFAHYSFRLWGNLYSVFDAIALFGWSGFQADDSGGQWCLVYLKPVVYTVIFLRVRWSGQVQWKCVDFQFIFYYKNEVYVFLLRCKQCIINKKIKSQKVNLE